MYVFLEQIDEQAAGLVAALLTVAWLARNKQQPIREYWLRIDGAPKYRPDGRNAPDNWLLWRLDIDYGDHPVAVAAE